MTEPSSESAERAVLGTFMLYPEQTTTVARTFNYDHFYDIKLKTVFRAVTNALDANEPPTSARVLECLRKMEKLEAVGGAMFIESLSDYSDIPERLPSHIRLLEELRQKRQLGRAARTLVESLGNGSDPEEALAAFEVAKGAIVPKASADDPLHFLDLVKMAEDGIPKKDWLIPGWLATDDVAVFAGMGGIGKSTTAAAMAVALAQGMAWCGLTPTGCGVKALWFDEEQGDSETARTFIRLGGHDTANLQVHSSVGLNLKDAAMVARLEATIVAFEPRVLFLDSAQQCFGIKDENSAVEVGEVFRTLFRLRTQYGLAIFIVHHKKKSQGGSTSDDIELVRGSTAFTTQASMVCLASKGPEEFTLDLKMTKRRGGKKLTMRVRYFEEHEDGPIHLTSDGTVFRSDNDLCREWLVDFIGERPEVKRALLVVAAKVHGYSDNRVDRCLEQLLVDNLITKHKNAVYTVRGRLPKDSEN